MGFTLLFTSKIWQGSGPEVSVLIAVVKVDPLLMRTGRIKGFTERAQKNPPGNGFGKRIKETEGANADVD